MKDLSSQEAYALLHAFVLGSDRGSGAKLPESLVRARPRGIDDVDAMLDAIAIVSQRERVTRRWPLVPKPDEVDSHAERFIPATLRDDVRALVGVHDAAEDHLVEPTLELIQKSGLRLHPFDHGHFQRAAKEYSYLLHPEDRAILAPNAVAMVNEDNWLEVGPAPRDAWLRRKRMVDPAAVRELIGKELASEQAETRSRVFAVLGIRLSSDDREVIESFVNDRSGKVKAMAAAFLACMPGTLGYAERLDDLLDNFVSKRKGLLRRKHFSYRNPSRDGATCAEDTIAIRASDLIETLGIGHDPAKWPEMSDDIKLAFAVAYLADSDAETAGRMGAAAGADWIDFLLALDGRGVHYPVDRELLSEALVRVPPGRWSAGDDAVLVRLANVWPDGLPANLAARLVSQVSNQLVERFASELVTMLSPAAFAELRQRFPTLENHGRVAAYGRLVEFVLAPIPRNLGVVLDVRTTTSSRRRSVRR